MNIITPAQAGVSNANLEAFMNKLTCNGVNMHSVLLARSGSIFHECYWHPYDRDTTHRMYSVTKSFISVAIGLLAEEGKLQLDDPVIRYFPDKLPEVVPPALTKQTIRHMLMMCTCFAGGNWFRKGVVDRTAWYFAQEPDKAAGTVFHYDSTGSYVLGVLVERLSGMPLLDYLRSRFFQHIGGFENAEILQTPDGTPWGDSALLCTPRDLLRFAQFVMQRGCWEGKQLVNAEYIRQATTCQIDNNLENRVHYDRYGYGYQFWMTEHEGFCFSGMGGQFAICLPDKELILVCTGDNQLNARELLPVIFDAFFGCIYDQLTDKPLPPEAPWQPSGLALPVVRGQASCPVADRIAGHWYCCETNPMEISRFRLDFAAQDEGVFTYINEQGEKQLPFGMSKNIICPFPQAGYSDLQGNVHEMTDFRYRCAVSAGWVGHNQLQLSVQIIDRYFGQLVITFGFVGDEVTVRMVKSAEDFLNEYDGWLNAHME